MLRKLSIRNYAIIDELDIDLSAGLNILTGETGAGKSIIMGALGLILGERADSGTLMNREKKCIIEGSFIGERLDENVNNYLLEQELDIQDELVVRREIAPNGKSRAFINDTPVNLSQLNHLSALLVDLHQQFDTLSLGETNFQRNVLDALAGNKNLLKEYRALFQQATTEQRNWQQLAAQKEQFSKEFDYHQFQFTELDEAAFKENELEDLEQELKIQSNAEAIRNALSKAYHLLEESEEPLVRQLKSIAGSLQSFREIHPDLPSLIQRLDSAYIELQDIAGETDRLNRQINADADVIERINERLSLGYKLLKKHGVKSTAELQSIKDQLQKKLDAVLNIDEQISGAEKKYKELLSKAETLAEKISAARKKVVPSFEKQVNAMLANVGMPNAKLKVSISGCALSADGSDLIEFLFDANKSGQFQPIRKVASGGELSRLMLCIKSLVARSMNMPTLIFDEIDTGISGEAAKQVGVIMKELSAARQVICITHQPQIAGKADAHLLVYKAVKGEKVTTAVKFLSQDERIVAIAKMLSGEKPTSAAMENAREMIMN